MQAKQGFVIMEPRVKIREVILLWFFLLIGATKLIGGGLFKK